MYTQKDNSLYALASPWITANSPDWEPLLSFAQKKIFCKGEMIIDIGEQVDQLYYLKKGQIKMTALTKSGFEKTIWYINSPSVFGEVPLFNQQVCKFQINANSNCEVYTFSAEFVQEELVKYPQITSYIFKVLAQKVRVLSSQIEDLTFNNPTYRVAKLLYILAFQNGLIEGNSCTINIRLTHQELANITGLHRVTATNALKKICESGIVEKSRNKIVIHNLEALKLLIDES